MGESKKHTGMRIEPEKLDKLNFAAWHSRRTFTTTLEIAIDDFLTKWERENIKITPAKIKEMEAAKAKDKKGKK